MYTDGASVVPREGTPVNNRALNYDQETPFAVGQFPLVQSDYKQDARWKLPAGLPNGHVCESQWLATGEPWPNNLPPSRWSESNWPDCCGVMVEGTRGGLAFGSLPERVSGGLAFGGSAGDVFAPAVTVSGGLAFGGFVLDRFTTPVPVSGGYGLEVVVIAVFTPVVLPPP